MLRSVNPTWAEPKMKPKGAASLFAGVVKYVESRLEKGAEVEIAQVGPACDGMAALNFLSDVACCTTDCPPSSGPFVLANRKHGIPTLLSAAVSRPFAGMSGETTVVSTVMTAGAPSGRFFTDVFGNLFEGRNLGYHHGRRVVRQPNGTPIVYPAIGLQKEALVAGQYAAAWGFVQDEGAPHSTHDTMRFDGTGWAGLYPAVPASRVGTPPQFDTTPPYDFFATGHSPHFCMSNGENSLEVFGPNYGTPIRFNLTGTAYLTHEQAFDSWLWTGNCESNEVGYRPSSWAVASIEGVDTTSWSPTAGYVRATHYKIMLCFRDSETLELLASVHLSEVEDYAHTFTSRMGAHPYPWRAGVQVRRGADDGTFVVSVLDGRKAWVYEITRSRINDETPYSHTVNKLETVTLPEGSIFHGAARVVYL